LRRRSCWADTSGSEWKIRCTSTRVQLTPNNATLVEKGVRIVESLGGHIATIAEARTLLGLRESTVATSPSR
jgi:hypothetical protein